MTAVSLPDIAAAPRFSLWNRLKGLSHRSATAVIGGIIVAIFGLLSIVAPWIVPYDPILPFTDKLLAPPSAEHWFGTDGNGMDVFSRVIYATRYAFGIAIPAVLLSLAIGVPIGLWTGYRGGWADEVTLRFSDALRVFPLIILSLAVVAAAGQSLINVVLVIGILDAPVFVRVVRAEVLQLRNSTFVEAAVATGNPVRRILFVHLMLNATKGAMAQVAVRAAWAVRITATLAFFGVGIEVPTPEWGSMIRQGAEFMATGQWWVGIFPGIALIVMVLGLNMLGDGLQDLLDPRRRASAR
ncbi:MAG: ABC transporter permease [Alphaproteobacteria bacterium]|nr:ABC transporter permease [Alphaproteobacteria bacterium]